MKISQLPTAHKIVSLLKVYKMVALFLFFIPFSGLQWAVKTLLHFSVEKQMCRSFGFLLLL